MPLHRREALDLQCPAVHFGNMISHIRTILAPLCLLAAFPVASFAQSDSDWAALEEQDLRLARLADRLLTANAALCNNRMPVTGIVLHSSDQYRDGAASDRFANGPVAVMTLRPDSPALRAGLRRDDAILSINGNRISDIAPPATGNLREAAFNLLADQAPDSELQVRIARGDGEVDLVIEPEAGCRSLVEIRVGEGPRARSDGRVIQISYDFARQLDDDQLAVALAHELAHSVLEHRRRKEEAGIDVGLFGEIGRNQRANRQAEVEADRLSVHLLANAGFDPALAPSFWRTGPGQDLGGGIFGSWIYPSVGARADLIDEEIRLYLPLLRGPSWPGHLLQMRETSFASD